MNSLSLSSSAHSCQLLKSVGKAPGWGGASGGGGGLGRGMVVRGFFSGGGSFVGGGIGWGFCGRGGGGGVEPPLGGLVELAKEIDAGLLVLVFVLFFM